MIRDGRAHDATPNDHLRGKDLSTQESPTESGDVTTCALLGNDTDDEVDAADREHERSAWKRARENIFYTGDECYQI